MAANGDKTNIILVTTYQKESKLPVKELTVYYDNNLLKSVDSDKRLGVNINKHWKEHANQEKLEHIHFITPELYFTEPT